MKIKIGLLLPNASNYPYLANHYVSGLRLALDQQNVEFELFFESTGNGVATEVILEKAQKLFIQSGVQLLMVYASDRVASSLIDLAEANRRMLYFTNLGTTPVFNNSSNFLLYNTMKLWESVYLTGKKAGKENGKVFVASGFYEAGFYFSHALEQGLTIAGGTIIGYKVAKDEWEAADIQEIRDNIEEDNLVFTTVSEPTAADFLRHFSELENPPKLIVGGLTHLGGFAEEIEISLEGHISWDIDLKNATNQDFCDTYQSENSESPTLFSQMGHEAGLILAKQQELGAFNQRNGFIKEDFTLVSTRGELKYAKETDTIHAPQYQFAFNKKSKSKEIGKNFKEIDVEKLFIEYTEKVQNLDNSGWQNPYPCS